MENITIRSTPKDVFLHLFNIVTFYLSVIGFITLYIQYVDAVFPDALDYYFTAIANRVRWSTSILFIATPAFLFTAWLFAKDLTKNPEKRELKLRKWLIYFTLFLSAITIIIDLMIFVYNFLNGELTVRFFLKVLIVLLVAVAVFSYYMWELKRQGVSSRLPRIFTSLILLALVASIVSGFFIVGTPKDQRQRRFDELRVSDLQMLQNEIVQYWSMKYALPATLVNLEDSISGFIVPTDPDNKQPYEYKIIDQLTFELCATFSQSSQAGNNATKGERYYPYPVGYTVQNWDHDIGQKCFSRNIDPQLYKPVPDTGDALIPAKPQK